MDYSFHFWDASYSHPSPHLFLEQDSPQQLLPARHALPAKPQMDTTTGPLDNPNDHQVSTEPEDRLVPCEGICRLLANKRGGNIRSGA